MEHANREWEASMRHMAAHRLERSARPQLSGRAFPCVRKDIGTPRLIGCREPITDLPQQLAGALDGLGFAGCCAFPFGARPRAESSHCAAIGPRLTTLKPCDLGSAETTATRTKYRAGAAFGRG